MNSFVLVLRVMFSSLTLLAMSGMVRVPAANLDPDPYLWLEEIESERTLDWVKIRNQRTLATLEADPRYATTETAIRQIALAADRIPRVSVSRDWLYNFWQDEHHVRGVWRRIHPKAYGAAAPRWETLLDLDALAEQEHENWVWQYANCGSPAQDRCLIFLSRGGADAAVVREFDLRRQRFVSAGFTVPEAKTMAAWVDREHVIVGTDFGPGTLTDSGYPRTLRLWRRGTPLAAAPEILSGNARDVGVDVATYRHGRQRLTLLLQSTSFYTTNLWVFRGAQRTSRQLAVPADLQPMGLFRQRLLLLTRSEWTVAGQVIPAGALVSIDPRRTHPDPRIIYRPTARTALQQVGITRDALYLATLENVQGHLTRYAPRPGGRWSTAAVPLPEAGALNLYPTDPAANTLLVQYENFLTPSTVLAVGSAAGKPAIRTLRKLPDRFDSTRFEVRQLEARSTDGTLIPYFVVQPKNLAYAGQAPTLQYGYGGFEIALVPSYLGTTGKLWLERGGVFVLANIRGGGEFGPRWHQAALREHRQTAFDDFISVAEDLIARHITAPAHLGIQGGSNGGLLVGATFVQRPELFNAVLCEVPLLDMLRYHRLLAGASWMEEYGDPDDPRMREAILKYSPYQNLRPDVKYPDIFLVTSTQDDRVHPAHARKFAARLEAYGQPFHYFENIEGGHGAAANLEQQIRRKALEFTYLYRALF